jgi:hypothetical protein
MEFLMLRFVLAFAIAALAMGSDARAGTVLQFSQTNLNDHVTATDNGGVTTLATTGNADGAGVSIPVLLVTSAGISPGTVAFETYVNVVSIGPATTLGGTITQAYSGTIELTSLAGGGGINFLTATFAGMLTGPTGGTAASLVAANPPNNLILTSGVLGQLLNPTSMSISFSNVSPFLTIASTNGSVDSFVAQNAGTFGATLGQGAVPEPSSIMLSFIGMGTVALVARLRARFKRSSTT